ncbi:MAG: ATP-binding protein [Candidatus Peribacteria bacterium]|jgi:AAA+ ATPase superfamily predicted ATPase|nr:ATP-binding protein [Candidatus Peribacteria bacterium]
MKFYDRKQEIEVLNQRLTSSYFDLIYLLGKRRVGKTELIQHLHTNILQSDFLYLFVERMDLSVFLTNQQEYMEEKLGVRYEFRNIEDFLNAFFSQDKINILVIDEFQNFNHIDKSIFSTFQKKVDEYHKKSNKKIIVLGSLQSMMIKIFENANEPLYKRATFHLFLKEFGLETQIEILKDLFGKQYTHKILLDLYSIFG